MNIPHGSDAWHKIRRTHVTASTAAAILGVSPWETREDHTERRIYEKVYGRIEQEPNEPMKEGIEWEPRLIEMSRPDVLRFGPNVYNSHGYKVHAKYPWIGASPDAVVVSPQGKIIEGLEVKKQFSRSKKGPLDWLPAKRKVYHYWIQCQMSMEVFDVDVWHFFASNGDWSVHEPIPRDRDWFNENLPAFKAWIDEFEAGVAQLEKLKASLEKV